MDEARGVKSSDCRKQMCQTRTFNCTRDVRVALSFDMYHVDTASAIPIYSVSTTYMHRSYISHRPTISDCNAPVE